MRRAALLLGGLLIGCAGGTPEPDAGVDAGADVTPRVCTVKAPTGCPTPARTYTEIKPIIDARCVVCHDGARWDGPWPLVDYPHVADWQDQVRIEVLGCTMPPQDAGFVMPDEEKTKILEWVRCGAPQ